jgi:hypothetical protein
MSQSTASVNISECPPNSGTLGALNCRVTEAHSAVDRLERHISGVLTPEPPVSPVNANSIGPAGRVQSDLADVSDRVDQLARRIGRIADRVEV